MSLVERALKKLQESRSTTPAATFSEQPTVGIVGGATATSPPADLAVRSAALRATASTAQTPAMDVIAPVPSRRVTIDRDALRAMELLPPLETERQIANQYQQVKRPLIASALGRGVEPVHHGRAIMLASAIPGEGKTFTSVNLALSMALEKDTEVLLVDADVAKPHLTRIFGLQGERGLLDLLADSSAHPESFIFATDVPGLKLLPSGKQNDTATELLASKRMEQIVGQLTAKDEHRIVLFDSPPLLLSTESRALVASVGQVVLVVRAEVTPQRAVQQAIELIGDDKVVSLILNQTHVPASAGYYGYGSYGDAAAPGREPSQT